MNTSNKTIIQKALLKVLKRSKAELRKNGIACIGNTILARLVKQFLSDMKTFNQRCERGNRESHATTRLKNVQGKLYIKSKYPDMRSSLVYVKNSKRPV